MNNQRKTKVALIKRIEELEAFVNQVIRYTSTDRNLNDVMHKKAKEILLKAQSHDTQNNRLPRKAN
uniref:Uncharacterized protein n=1 Tax=Sphingobacterium sp. (strain 21) TaxID=743722 RepID=F4C2F0_SPHS2